MSDTTERYEVRYWLESDSQYVVLRANMTKGDAVSLAVEMRRRRPRNRFTYEIQR